LYDTILMNQKRHQRRHTTFLKYAQVAYPKMCGGEGIKILRGQVGCLGVKSQPLEAKRSGVGALSAQ